MKTGRIILAGIAVAASGIFALSLWKTRRAGQGSESGPSIMQHNRPDSSTGPVPHTSGSLEPVSSSRTKEEDASQILQSIARHIAARQDPDEWLGEIWNLELVISKLPESEIARLARGEELGSARDEVLPIIWIAIGRSSSSQVSKVLEGEIDHATTRTIWGLVAALGVPRQQPLLEKEELKFWQAGFFDKPLGLDSEYSLRYLKKHGFVSPESTSVVPTGSRSSVAPIVSPLPFSLGIGRAMLNETLVGRLMDRFESLSRDIAITDLQFVLDHLPVESTEAKERATKWVQRRDLPAIVRGSGLRRVTQYYGWDQAFSLARVALGHPDEDPLFVDEVASLLDSSAARDVAQEKVEEILIEGYKQQFASNKVSERVVQGIMSRATRASIAVGMEVLASVRDEAVQGRVVANLDALAWGQSNNAQVGRESLLMQATRSQYEGVRARAVWKLSGFVSRDQVLDRSKIGIRFAELAEGDDSEQVRSAAKTALKDFTPPREDN